MVLTRKNFNDILTVLAHTHKRKWKDLFNNCLWTGECLAFAEPKLTLLRGKFNLPKSNMWKSSSWKNIFCTKTSSIFLLLMRQKLHFVFLSLQILSQYIQKFLSPLLSSPLTLPLFFISLIYLCFSLLLFLLKGGKK